MKTLYYKLKENYLLYKTSKACKFYKIGYISRLFLLRSLICR